MVLLLAACDSGLEYVKLEISSYPDKIVYIKDVDTRLSVKGLELILFTKDGQSEILKEAKDYNTNVDFSKEGVYTVAFKICDGVSVSYPVQVISKEWLLDHFK